MVLSLNDQLARKEKDLQGEQEKLTEFERTNDVAVLEEESRSAGLYLADLNLQIAKLKLDRDLLANGSSLGTNEPSAMPSLPSPGATNTANGTSSNTVVAASENKAADLASSPSSDAALKSARFELAVKRAERDQTVAEHGETAARRLSDEVKDLERNIGILEEQNLAEKRLMLDERDRRIAAMQESIPSWEARVLKINDRVSESQRLRNNVKREQGYYDSLLATLQNVDLGKNIQQERLSILQPPTSAQPEKRNLPLRVALAAIFGLFLSLGIVFGWYLLDDRFVSVRDIKDQFGETLLGLVPQIKVPRAKPQAALLDDRDSRPAYVESYRHLRSALLLSNAGKHQPQTLLFTSAGPAEGKTTIAVNLARLLARSGLRVALVDADARGGGMNRLLGDKEQLGVLDYLRGGADSKAVVHPTEFDGLSFVPGGTHNEHAEGFVRAQDSRN